MQFDSDTITPPTTPATARAAGSAAAGSAAAGSAAAGGAVAITDPRTGALVGWVDFTTDEELTAAVDRVAAALPGWRRISPADRGRTLATAAELLAESELELAELNHRETGRPLEQALEGVRAGVSTLEQYAELGPLHTGRTLRGGSGAIDYTVPEPRGVVAVLTPWNDPVAVAVGLIGAALVTGNTVVHKPSERCPHLGSRLGEVLASAFPRDVLVSVSGDGSTGARLIAHPAVSTVAHVGSSATGERIARAAALTGAHVVRENGGNDALIVDEGVDPRWAAEQAAIGAFTNTGQLCTAVERIYVHEAVAEPFVAALVERAGELNRSGALGPLVDERMRQAVHEQVADAVQGGATALVGGEVPAGPGSFYPATVLTGCRPGMTVMQEETFGPVAPIQVVRSFAEGLRLADDDRYGLSAVVLTPSMEHAQQAAEQLAVGTVKVNDVFGGAPGGSAEPRKASGSGFGYGPGLLDELTLTKVVHIGTPR
jgi:acyl-CoA reductase-like NAD-dependent aldehyde dehydrogenase